MIFYLFFLENNVDETLFSSYTNLSTVLVRSLQLNGSTQ